MRRLAFALLLLTFAAQAADAMVLSCFPERKARTPGIDAYVDGFAEGEYPPKTIEAIRVLARFGEDVYEFFPEQVKALDLRDGALRIHLVQPLSAGETAELRLEGKIGAVKGEPFLLALTLRNERRSGAAEVRCTIE
jgi:hypothetical protein